jgi:hypothetical protein
MVSAAILDGPYPDTGQVGMRAATETHGGDASCHQGSYRGCGGATNARDGSSRGHQGSYRGRGCPESPQWFTR